MKAINNYPKASAAFSPQKMPKPLSASDFHSSTFGPEDRRETSFRSERFKRLVPRLFPNDRGFGWI
jgi:hypothetical protein